MLRYEPVWKGGSQQMRTGAEVHPGGQGFIFSCLFLRPLELHLRGKGIQTEKEPSTCNAAVRPVLLKAPGALLFSLFQADQRVPGAGVCAGTVPVEESMPRTPECSLLETS
ncbi:hypothetical protein NDU88_004754 [Pleurodeles waltl]|uniref:Uncharacterized protein n=1 Tax=Pleurodeles waltl TaxID=8319 RepID=A0AAV7T8H7_PLEWA|nr:hypothetical protein NDU88_004754 [Pleurodeles waltl]